MATSGPGRRLRSPVAARERRAAVHAAARGGGALPYGVSRTRTSGLTRPARACGSRTGLWIPWRPLSRLGAHGASGCHAVRGARTAGRACGAGGACAGGASTAARAPGVGCRVRAAALGPAPSHTSNTSMPSVQCSAVRCGVVRCVSCLSAPRRGPWSLGVAASERRARVPVRTAWRRGRPAGRSVPGCGAAVRPRRSARP